MSLLTTEVATAARDSVLCWLATVDADGQPNVSPKEIYAVFDDSHIVVANIASPRTVRNIAASSKVCVTFVDVFVQKGFKVYGAATNVGKDEPDFDRWAAPLLRMAGARFPIHSVIVVRASGVEPVVAPSYRLYPEVTTERSQIESALRTYGVALGRRGV
ncbi:MAG: pyridoxamine 5'-phosphate oxidase family protein [Burkholderiales bacterium]